MDNPGPFQFTLNGQAFPIGAAAIYIGDAITGFAGLDALTLQAQFLYGSSGGTSVTVFFQTSIDQGQTWFDIAAIEFTTLSGQEVANLSGLTPVTTPYTPGSQQLTPGTCKDGLLGDRFRAVVVVVGAYLGMAALNLTGVAR